MNFQGKLSIIWSILGSHLVFDKKVSLAITSTMTTWNNICPHHLPPPTKGPTRGTSLLPPIPGGLLERIVPSQYIGWVLFSTPPGGGLFNFNYLQNYFKNDLNANSCVVCFSVNGSNLVTSTAQPPQCHQIWKIYALYVVSIQLVRSLISKPPQHHRIFWPSQNEIKIKLLLY